MTLMRRTIMLAALSLAVLFAAVPAHAAAAEPLVQSGDVYVLTGDYDILEDVMEHISMPSGDGNAMMHQMYDHSGASVPE
ncbi:hypothetical protein [Streptomyces acidicola]|uniref:Uncharacterized protein n=1 Tax=Streptomyces acidicola TaxID=2596892 RepID=A0A5N8WYZ7_9ACTN|nr:hypothetical protein [Streptomyces acidicola]MPY52593.1 hypothetical protein [Streptomyces acidicola]